MRSWVTNICKDFSTIRSRLQKFACERLAWMDFGVNSIYIALISYFYLSMFHVPQVFRFLIPLSTMIKNMGLQFLVTLMASAGPVIYEHFYPYFDETMVYLAALSILLLYVEIRKLQKNSLGNELGLLVLGFAAHWIIDVSLKNAFFLWKLTYFEADFPVAMCRIFSFYIIIQLISLINLFMNEWRVSALIGFNGMFILGAVNYWTMAITNKEFMFSDVYLIKTVGKVINGVQVRTGDVLYFLLYLALIVIFNIVVIKLKWQRVGLKRRLNAAVVSVLYLTVMIWVLLSGTVPSSYKGYMKLGFVSNLIAGIDIEGGPTGYEEYLKELTINDSYVDDVSNVNEKVNVIMIMSEAFSDLSVIGEFEMTEDPIPFTRELMQNYPSGYLYSSTFGNGTASSEYESLTGVPTGLTKTGGQIYQSFMEEKEYSLVEYFKNLGYKTIGMHPYDGEGYNRRNAWKSFGFDEMMFVEDFEKTKYVRDFLSDETFYEHVVTKYEEKGDEPLFLFGITMQNHATYLTDFEKDVKLMRMNYPDVDEYLSLLKITDAVNKKLIEYFAEQDEKTMLVFFGDHQPMVSNEFYEEVMGIDFYDVTGEQQALKYKIPYFIWTNFEADYDVPEEISTNYLPSVIIEVLGYPKTDWFVFMDKVMEQYPVITDNFVKVQEEYINIEEMENVLDSLKVPNREDSYHLLKLYETLGYERALELNMVK